MKGADRQPPRPTRTASCSGPRVPARTSRTRLSALLTTALLFCASSVLADTQLLFDQAGQLKDSGQCESAIELYAELLASPTLSELLRAPALYNQATCFELVGRINEAMLAFVALADSTKSSVLRRDALFRMASLDIDRNRLRSAVRRLRRVLSKSTSPDDKIRTHILLAEVALRRQNRRCAAHHLRRTKQLLAGLKEPLDPWYIARQQLLLGDLFLLEASRISLRSLQPRRIVALLEERGLLLERAQQHFIASLAAQQPRWMQVATYHLGKALLSMAEEMTVAESLLDSSAARGSRDDREHLRSWLSNRRPAMARKAFESFQLCLDVQTESGLTTASSRACREHIEGFAMKLLSRPEPP